MTLTTLEREPRMISHFPKLFFISKNNSVIYAKHFDDTISYDPELVACSLNGLSLFLQNTFNKPHIDTMTLDNLGLKNIIFQGVSLTYLFEGMEIDQSLYLDFIAKLMDKDIWPHLLNYNLRLNDEIISVIDEIATEWFT